MNTTRIQMLEKFMQNEPGDPFPVYALALEYQRLDKPKARQLFELVLAKHPDYLPAYYMAGNFFLGQNEVDRAIEVLQRGLTLAKAQNNQATVREIQAVLDNID
ncbi:MAG: tetratricopeptide repeat protein [Cyclobacteriaceae bacterium]|nr:tetratricopeptide repeat protein [Cyclobacteriaceae bacterium]